jgi:hypothetical protein
VSPGTNNDQRAFFQPSPDKEQLHSSLYHKPFVGATGIIQPVTAAISIYCTRNSQETMKLDDWLTRLVAVPPGRSPLANGLAIGMRIAFFILIPLGIIAAIAIVLLHR